MRLFLDFETRSTVDLKTAGMYRYAEDSSTQVLCCAYKVDDQPSRITLRMWNNPNWEKERLELGALMDKADEIHAANACFERLMSWHCLGLAAPLEKWRCTLAKAAYFALPRNLDQACSALGLLGKDKVGYSLMMKFCKPRRALLADKELYEDWAERTFWYEEPADFEQLCHYCRRDVEIEYELDRRLPTDLPESELEVWRADQRINDRGVRVDLQAITAITARVEEAEQRLELEAQRLSHGTLSSTNQVAALLTWLEVRGLKLSNLQAETVDETLRRPDLNPEARRMLEIRRALAKASVAKLTAMARMVCKDGRVRGMHRYYGADTGRWSGNGVQTQNLPRKTDPEGPEAFQLMTVEELEAVYGDVFAGASQCIRPVFIAGEGRTLLARDYASIEGRVLAWLAGEEYVLQHYRDGHDMYKVSYSAAFGTPYEEVTKPQRTVGKPIELGLGFGGWIGALRKMGETYRVEFPDDDECKRIVLAWRDSRPATTAYWANLWQACLETVRTGHPHAVGAVKFGIRDEWLHTRLPSGRLLSYYQPRVETRIDLYKREKETLTFMGIDGRLTSPTYKKWVRIATWYGVIVENIVQAVARDLLAGSLVRLEREKLNTVLHIHDEVVLEEDDGSAEGRFAAAMEHLPDWAAGLPIGTEGWVGRRFRKD
jgi:DNA polymerase bacteriophage-type